MPLNPEGAEIRGSGEGDPHSARGGRRLVGNLIKFPDDGHIVRFGRADGPDRSATIIILPVVRIERYADQVIAEAEPQTHPPTDNNGRRRVRRR
jgi:hypothetical protein